MKFIHELRMRDGNWGKSQLMDNGIDVVIAALRTMIWRFLDNKLHKGGALD